MAADARNISVNSESKGERQQNLIVFGDLYISPETYAVLTQALELLQANGYGTIYLQSPSSEGSIKPANVDDLINSLTQIIMLLKLFSNENTIGLRDLIANLEPLEKCYPILKSHINKGTLQDIIPDIINDIKKTIAFCRPRHEWLNSMCGFLEKAKHIGIKIICIDIPHTAGKPSDRARNQYMANKILEGVRSFPNTNGVVIVNFAYLFEGWEKACCASYTSSITRLLLKSGINIRRIFAFYPKNSKLIREAEISVQFCSSATAQLMHLTPITSVEEGAKIVLDGCKNPSSEREEKTELKYRYHIPICLNQHKNSYNKAHFKHLKEYVSDFGGVIDPNKVKKSMIPDLYYISVILPFSLVTKPIDMCRSLGLHRCLISQSILTEANLMKLAKSTPCTIEREVDTDAICFVPEQCKSSLEKLIAIFTSNIHPTISSGIPNSSQLTTIAPGTAAAIGAGIAQIAATTTTASNTAALEALTSSSDSKASTSHTMSRR